MVEIIWKEPPPVVSSEKAAILAELQKHPGRWALVQERRSSTSAAAPWKKLGCEAVYRKSEQQGGKSVLYDIYARWPEPKAKPSLPPAARVVPAPGGATYDPGLGRAARGVPEDGLPVESLRR